MLKLITLQVKRLFSAKTNGAKLINNPIDRLHSYKQFLLAASLVLLLGYSQFRDHFQCQGKDNLDKKHLTTWCWVNGTTTLSLKDDTLMDYRRYIPHVGIRFAPAARDKFEILVHNYMRSLWALLLLMALCSFIAQRRWASIFDHDILRALLKLPGYEELPLVKRAQELKAYDKLCELANSQKHFEINSTPTPTPATTPATETRTETTAPAGGGHPDQQVGTPAAGNKLGQLDVLFHSIEIITGDQNEHNHTLDYYPNQLIYLLMAKRTSAYKLTGLKLRRKLLNYSLCSYLLTVMQFLLPTFIIGPDYLTYGLYYAKAWFRFTLKLIIDPGYNKINTIDYELSQRIFPTSTSCEYKEFGIVGRDRNIVQCTVPINEICSKLFALIWWFIVVNIIIELYALISVLVFSLNFATIKWSFARLLTRRTCREAEVIATFRYQHAMLLNKLLESTQLASKAASNVNTTNANRDQPEGTEHDEKAKGGDINNNNNNSSSTYDELSERDKKQLEAEAERLRANNGGRMSPLGAKKWDLWCSRDICLYLAERSGQIRTSKPARMMMMGSRTKTPEDGDGFKELREDLNVYYLLHLLYLRLNCSRRKIGQIVRMTSDALGNYLENLRRVEGDIGQHDATGGGGGLQQQQHHNYLRHHYQQSSPASSAAGPQVEYESDVV